MRYALVFCMMLFTLNSETPPANNKSVDKQTCSLGNMPTLQAYCLKKTRKERMRCLQEKNCFKQAFDNTLHFIDINLLDKLMPCLK